MLPPQAYIIGAPKCGTTALAAYLAEHPAIAFARPKEPHFYASDLAGLRIPDDAAAYAASFPQREESRIAMEGSVWYLYSQTAVAAIEAARPDALYIVMLRNPVAMALSLHRQLLNAFDEEIADFAAAWQASGDRAAGRRIPARCRAPSTLVYTETCALGRQVERLFSLVPRERCLVLFQEELQADTAATYRRALDFLGLPDDGRQAFARVNEAAEPRSWALHLLVQRGGRIRTAISDPIKRALGVQSLGLLQYLKRQNIRPAQRSETAPDILAAVSAHFAPDVALAGRLLGRDLVAEFGWPSQG